MGQVQGSKVMPLFWLEYRSDVVVCGVVVARIVFSDFVFGSMNKSQTKGADTSCLREEVSVRGQKLP